MAYKVDGACVNIEFNVMGMIETNVYIIDVEWEREPGGVMTYRIETHIEGMERMNLLRDVIAVLSEEGVNVLNSSSAVGRDGIVRMRYLFEVSDVDHVDEILQSILKVDGVFEARRMFPGEYVGAGK